MIFLLKFYIYIPNIMYFFFFLLFSFFSLLKLNDYFYKSNEIIKNYLSFWVTVFFVTLVVLIIFKIILYFFFVRQWLPIITYTSSDFTILLYYFDFFLFGQYTQILGFSLLLLCLLTTLFSLFYLGDRDFFTKGSSMLYFFFFFCTFVMVNTSNILILFISFELIFFPSLYFVYTLGYVKKVDKTILYLLLWTLFGSFLVFFGISYIYIIFGTLEFKQLMFKQFTSLETTCLFSLFFIGFGIKIPIFPFHYWLTKVHVEAPAGFSMFLSGFLVKTALYCFYYLNLLFTTNTIKPFFILWICFCIIEASVKMWVQVDLKKLIAFATIQEMNMLLLLILISSTLSLNILSVFILMHGLLSTYMFFLVDQIQKRAQTRNLLSLGGFATKYKFFFFFIWLMLILYLGLPFTIKFIIEWHVGLALLTSFSVWGCIIFFFAIFFGGLGFVKCWLFILYGNLNISLRALKVVDFLKKDRIFAYYLIFSLFILNFIIYFI